MNMKVGEVYVITYTRKNVNFLSFIIIILFFSVFSIIYFQNIFKFPILNNQIYKKEISLEERSVNENQGAVENIEDIQNSAKSIEEVGETNQDEIIKTQRKWIEEYKGVKWRIQIPKINLDVHIEETTSLDVMLHSVGHFEETSKWNGNVGLAAHNRGNQCNFFQYIKNLKVGDEIIYITDMGKRIYKVQTNKVILETDWSYLQPTNDNYITLITCEENRKEYRRCIQAVEIATYENLI